MHSNRTSRDTPIIVMSVILSMIVVLLWMFYLGAIKLRPLGSAHVDRSLSISQPG